MTSNVSPNIKPDQTKKDAKLSDSDRKTLSTVVKHRVESRLNKYA